MSRRYREGTLVLETDFETADGTARVIDFMPPRDGGAPQLMRIVQGLRGHVPMRMQLIIRFGYGLSVPWVQRVPGGIVAQAGPDAVHLSTPVELHGQDLTTVAEFTVQEGASERFGLSWFPSYERPGRTEDADAALAHTQAWWREWSERCTYRGEYRDEVLTSLVVLKALTDQVTGAIVAAPTTSLPEDLGGERNWDYRYTWLRDSVLTLNALLAGGYTDEALAFSDAVFRATAGQPEQAQIMYGIAGERRLEEYDLDWLPGYEGSRPVRVGNAAAGQFQLDVYGEVVGVGWAVRPAIGQTEVSLPGVSRSALACVFGGWLPGLNGREREGGQAGGFAGGDAQQAQLGLGELVDGGLGDAFGVPLAHPQQPEQAAGHGAERDLGIGNGEPALGLPGLDVAQGTRRQAAGDVQDVQAGTGEEPGDVGVGPAEPPGDPGAHGEQLGRVGEAGGGPVDQLPPAFQHLLRGGREQLLLGVEVVVERPEADVGLLGDLGDARPVPAALGDQPHRGVDECLPGPGLTPVQPRCPWRLACRYRLFHHRSSCRAISPKFHQC